MRALLAIALACAAAVAFFWMRRSGADAGRAISDAPPAPVVAESGAPSGTTAAVPPKSPAARADLPVPAAPPPGLDRAAVASPEIAVQTALRLLESGQEDLFRETFLPAVRPQVTAEAFEACRRRVRQSRVQPDWEMAEEVSSDGHRVVRVSMFGKSETGFHELGGRWLADALWCRPVGLP